MKQEKNTLGAGDGLGATKINTKDDGGFKLRMRVKTFLWLMALSFVGGGVAGMWALIKVTPNDTANNEDTVSRYYEGPHPEEDNELPRAIPLPSGQTVLRGQNTGATSLNEADFQKLEQELATASAKKSGQQETNSDIMSMMNGLVESAKKALGELATKGSPPESVSSDFDVTSDCCVSESVLNKVFRGVLKGKGNAFIESGRSMGSARCFWPE